MCVKIFATILILIGIIGMIGLSSCSTIPHTNSEKYWLGAMIAANTGDVLYTKYKLDQDCWKNNIYGNNL